MTLLLSSAGPGFIPLAAPASGVAALTLPCRLAALCRLPRPDKRQR